MRPTASFALAVLLAVAAVAVFLLPLDNFWDWALSLTQASLAICELFVGVATRRRPDPRASTRIGRDALERRA